jgi:hypothetical protein
MPHTVATRSLTPLERQQLGASARLSLDQWTWVLVPGPTFGFVGYLLGRGAEWVFALLGLDIAPYARTFLAAAGVCFGLIASAYTYRAFQGAAKAAASDLRSDSVQVIRVSNAAVVQQQEYNDEGPIFYFQIDDDTILFLWGQWLFDPHIYGAENEKIAEDAETFLNGQVRRFAFPCTEFTIHRMPALGRVLRIETNGEPLSPARTLNWSDIPLSGLADCELLQGALDDLAGAMARRERVLESEPAPAAMPDRSR